MFTADEIASSRNAIRTSDLERYTAVNAADQYITSIWQDESTGQPITPNWLDWPTLEVSEGASRAPTGEDIDVDQIVDRLLSSKCYDGRIAELEYEVNRLKTTLYAISERLKEITDVDVSDLI